MKQISLSHRSMVKVFRSVLFVLLLAAQGCKPYEEVDFQAEKCKQAPSGNIRMSDKGNFRWEFDLEGLSNAVETEPIRVVWTIDGSTFAARRVSYQFDKRGELKISVVLTNRCFMQTIKETTVKVN